MSSSSVSCNCCFLVNIFSPQPPFVFYPKKNSKMSVYSYLPSAYDLPSTYIYPYTSTADYLTHVYDVDYRARAANAQANASIAAANAAADASIRRARAETELTISRLNTEASIQRARAAADSYYTGPRYASTYYYDALVGSPRRVLY